MEEDIRISDHALIRYLQRYVGVSLKEMYDIKHDDRAIIHYLRQQLGINIDDFRSEVMETMKASGVMHAMGFFGENGVYPIGKGVKAVIRGKVVVTFINKNKEHLKK